MGDIADYDIEQGMDMWLDHLAGHPNYPDVCPYCYEPETERGDDLPPPTDDDIGF